MKNVLAWIKSNLLIVVFCVITLVSLPTAFAFSGMWRERIRSEREKAANDEMSKVSKADVTYTIPAYDPGQKPLEYKGAPNAELTAWFKEKRDSLAEAATSLVRRAEDFNRGVGDDARAVGRSEHMAMVEGLFPDPKVVVTARVRKELGDEAFDAKTDAERAALVDARADELHRAKLNEMEEVLLGKFGRPYLYDNLLKSIHAGEPANPVLVYGAVKELFTRESDKITAGKRNLTPEEQADLAKKLVERRLADYQAASAGISLYASLKVWPQTVTKGFSSIPRGKIDPDNITLESFFVNQWDYWVYDDVFAAIRLANGDTGNPVGVANAVVKRIESFKLADPEGLFDTSDPMSGIMDAAPAEPPPAAVPGLVPLVPAVSVTGRAMGRWNTVYDIRRATLTVVVSSARINEFLDAIARTNFMTVTDMDIQSVDVWTDLKEGYYYGPEHVVRATVEIETVWLRSWMKNYMPPSVLSILGGEGGEAPATAPQEAAPQTSGRGRKGG